MATRRVAKVDIELGGHKIKAGEGIISATQSASRDEDVFNDPETFDILRFQTKEKGGRGEDWYQAMGYGWGQHRCVAEPLARGELEIVFGELQPFFVLCCSSFSNEGLTCCTATIFQRLPNLKLAIPFEEIKWSPPKKDVGILELPVVW
jgi:nitric oxide reductase